MLQSPFTKIWSNNLTLAIQSNYESTRTDRR